MKEKSLPGSDSKQGFFCFSTPDSRQGLAMNKIYILLLTM
jgi:hypothetical protein